MATITTLSPLKSKISLSVLKSPAGGNKTVTGPVISSVTSITQVGGLATLTMAGHPYRTGDTVVISNADQAGYNGSKIVTRTGNNTVTFTVDPATITPATGVILATQVCTRFVSSLTLSGETGTLSVSAHGFAAGASVTIAGATPSPYNGTYTIINDGTFGANAFTVNYAAVEDTTAEIQTAVGTALANQGWAVNDASANNTAGYQIVTVGGNQSTGTATGLIHITPATRGNTVFDFNTVTATDEMVGLVAGKYDFKVNVDSAGDVVYTIQAVPTDTLASLAAKMQVEIGALASVSATGDPDWSIYPPATTGASNSTLVVTSLTSGATSAVVVTEPAGGSNTDVFAAIDTALTATHTNTPNGGAAAVTNATFTASIDVDGGGGIPISFAGTSAPASYGELVAGLNTQLGGSAIAAIVSGNLRITSATTGVGSTVAITDATLFGSLKGYSAVEVAVAGGSTTGAKVYTRQDPTGSVDGYQIVNVGGGKTGVTATGLAADVPATAGNQTVNIGGAATNATASGLLADVPAVFGYQTVNVGGAKILASPTGLTNDATVYTASISIDGGAHVRPITVTGSAAQDYTTLITELVADSGAFFTAEINGGNLRIVGNGATGAASSVAITDGTLFAALTNFVSIDAAVPGVDTIVTTYTASIDVDGTHTQAISIAGGTAFPTMGDVVAALDTQLGGFATVTPLGAGGNIVIVSATTGALSSVAITAGTLFAGPLTGFVAVNAAVPGADITHTTYTASIVLDAGGAAHTQPISIVGQNALTYTTLLSQLNTQLAGHGIASLTVAPATVGNILVTSTSGEGTLSTVAITDTNLFSSLTGWVALVAAVPGTAGAPATSGYDYVNLELGSAFATNTSGLANDATAYTATVLIDAAGASHSQSVSIVGSASQTLADVIIQINADLGGFAVAALNGNTIRITSVTTGHTSSVLITDTNVGINKKLFTSLRNFVSNSPGPVGGNLTSYFKVDFTTVGKINVKQYGLWAAGVGTDEVVSSRHTVNIGDRPGTLFVYTYMPKRPALYIFN